MAIVNHAAVNIHVQAFVWIYVSVLEMNLRGNGIAESLVFFNNISVYACVFGYMRMCVCVCVCVHAHAGRPRTGLLGLGLRMVLAAYFCGAVGNESKGFCHIGSGRLERHIGPESWQSVGCNLGNLHEMRSTLFFGPSVVRCYPLV